MTAALTTTPAMAPMESDCGWTLLVEPSRAVTAERVRDVRDWLPLALPVTFHFIEVEWN